MRFFATAGGPGEPGGIHQLCGQTVVWQKKLSNNVLQKFAAFVKILKHWKHGKALKSITLSICLDLSASFAIF